MAIPTLMSLTLSLEVGIQKSLLFGHLRYAQLSFEGIVRFCDSIDYAHLTDEIWNNLIYPLAVRRMAMCECTAFLLNLSQDVNQR
jgi:hypothetical protein